MGEHKPWKHSKVISSQINNLLLRINGWETGGRFRALLKLCSIMAAVDILLLLSQTATWLWWCWGQWWAHLNRLDSSCHEMNLMLQLHEAQRKQESHSPSFYREQLLSSGSSNRLLQVPNLHWASPPGSLHSDWLLPPTWMTLNTKQRVISERELPWPLILWLLTDSWCDLTCWAAFSHNYWGGNQKNILSA